MIDVFEQNERIGNNNGMLFYEQDIARIKYIFRNDLEIKAEVLYSNTGIGFVIEKFNASSNKSASESYLVRIGNNSFSVYRLFAGKQERLIYTSCYFSPSKDSQELLFKKEGTRISVMSEGNALGQFELSTDFDEYKVCLYSNKGNTFKNITIKNNVPESWVTNIKNTNGGRVAFYNDTILFENCQQDGEVEQHDIFLEKGKYYLSFEQEGAVETSIFKSSDVEFNDRKKNLLKDGSFELDEDGSIVLRFEAKDAMIKNIQIKKEKDGVYVSTGDSARSHDGSQMEILLAQCLFVEWDAIIHRIPDDYSLNNKHWLLQAADQKIRMETLNIDLGKQYHYEFNVEEMTLMIYEGNEMKEKIEVDKAEKDIVVLFKNMQTSIKNLVVTNKDGIEINMILQKSYTLYVMPTKEPVLVYDENKEPLNLSSSYRFMSTEDGDMYEFTNTEREYFESADILYLSEKTRGEEGDLLVYGIPEGATMNWDSFLQKEEGLDVLQYFSNETVFIRSSSYTYEQDLNAIVIDPNTANKYEWIIVDYLKDNSYCINFDKEIGMNRIDIVTENEVVFVEHSSTEEGAPSIIRTEISPSINNTYIVLRERV